MYVYIISISQLWIRKLKFNSTVYVTPIYKLYKYCPSSVILCKVGEIFFMHVLYILALEHTRVLILGKYSFLYFKYSSSLHKHDL